MENWANLTLTSHASLWRSRCHARISNAELHGSLPPTTRPCSNRMPPVCSQSSSSATLIYQWFKYVETSSICRPASSAIASYRWLCLRWSATSARSSTACHSSARCFETKSQKGACDRAFDSLGVHRLCVRVSLSNKGCVPTVHLIYPANASSRRLRDISHPTQPCVQRSTTSHSILSQWLPSSRPLPLSTSPTKL